METFLGLEISEISIPGSSVFGVLKIMVHILCSIIYVSSDEANLIFIISPLLESEVSKSDVPYNTSVRFEK